MSNERCFVFRVNYSDNFKLIRSELANGILRQGWGANGMRIDDPVALSNIFEKLTDFVHPLVLGQVYRSKAQIQMMAEKLLHNQVTKQEKVKKIIDFLCSTEIP